MQETPLRNPASALHQFLMHDGNLAGRAAKADEAELQPEAEMEIGFNVSYVLDVLNALKCENVRILLTDSVSSVQIEDAASQSAAYVVMPMRL